MKAMASRRVGRSMRNPFCFLAALGVLFGTRIASADDAEFGAQQQKAVAANPPGVTLTLRLPEGRTQFHQGEVIPLTAVFASHLPDGYRLNTDPGSRDLFWNSDTFRVDPSAGATDPLRLYYAHEFGMAYSGPGPRFQDLSLQPTSIPFTLNEWLRFDAPGHYRVYLTSGRVLDRDKRDQNSLSFQGRITASNAVALDVLPDDPVWDAQTLQEALPLFDADSNDWRKQAVQEAAARTVRFLGTRDAARAMIARYGHFTEYDFWNSRTYFQIRLGLYGSPQRALIVHEMNRRVNEPDFPILPFFLNDLAYVQYSVAYPTPICRTSG